ncbi:MAG TPA: hypothetical protein VFS67_30100 [Polyangiaceae bacterium]|nr:hypothetical protein [Polyangiaceae bacterium]
MPVERARQFARAVLELDSIGRLALAVLDGGLFTGARLVELAEAVLHGQCAGDAHAGAGSEPGELRELHAAGEATRA